VALAGQVNRPCAIGAQHLRTSSWNLQKNSCFIAQSRKSSKAAPLEEPF
jgi:hypothetical protein